MSVHSTTNDLFDYIATLDPAEALGEIRHQRACYGRAHTILDLLGNPKVRAIYAEAMVPILFALADRLATGVPVPPIEPACDDTIHTCTLLARAYAARAAESGGR